MRQQELRRLSLLDTIKDKPKFQTAVDKTGRFIGFVTGVTREDREKKKPKGLQLYGAAFTHNGVHE